ncbi:Clp protease N-terminal domain-containing protein [Streptomyces sp. DSM 41699]|uniref:Clp protease N-terminal domain-containing protein n=1 Tax=Streptomyces gibsoniae TaxID=3075529 RepID=A0ABU2U506_9ACTN|nr:Clp protease N-terminal domain-containing protein [Streptomyces sp. DSM 41699]MDT0468175.1 Clp protease N-terminal domain-containing protein [Streptomyces sp. DSM 41699]
MPRDAGADGVGDVPPRHSQRSAAESGEHRTHLDARLTAELAAVVAGARRRAVRDGDRQTDTAHLLHTLLESDAEVRAVFDGPQVARLLGYLVQRAIGYGLRWQSTVEDSGALPVLCEPQRRSPAAASALTAAYGRAVRRGAARARGLDLLAAILTDPESRAVEVLVRAGVDVASLRARIEAGTTVEDFAAGPLGPEETRGGDGAWPTMLPSPRVPPGAGPLPGAPTAGA